MTPELIARTIVVLEKASRPSYTLSAAARLEAAALATEWDDIYTSIPDDDTTSLELLLHALPARDLVTLHEGYAGCIAMLGTALADDEAEARRSRVPTNPTRRDDLTERINSMVAAFALTSKVRAARGIE